MTATEKTKQPSGWDTQMGPVQISTTVPFLQEKVLLHYDALMLRFSNFYANLVIEITFEDDQMNGPIGFPYRLDLAKDPNGDRYVIFQGFGLEPNGSPRTSCLYSVIVTAPNLPSGSGTSIWHWNYSAKHAPVEIGRTLGRPWTSRTLVGQ